MTGIEEGALLAYVAAAGAAVAAVGTVYAADKQADAEDYNADVMAKNAIVARSEGNAREEAQRAHARQVIGHQLATTAQTGTTLAGSNLDLLNDSLYHSSIDSMNIRYESAVKASGLNDQAALDRSQASSTRTGGYISATGKLIGGSASYLNSGGSVPYAQGGGYGSTGYQSAGGLNNML